MLRDFIAYQPPSVALTNYIVYQSPITGAIRKMTVVDGQPYYQSTGRNSGVPEIWFPFIMMSGTKPIMSIPEIYNQDSIKAAKVKPSIKDPYYIIKLSHTTLKAPDIARVENDAILASTRMPLKSALIASSRLTGINFPERTLINARLSPEEFKLAQDPFIMEEKPLFTSRNPDDINQWLIIQGATGVPTLLQKSIKVEPEKPIKAELGFFAKYCCCCFYSDKKEEELVATTVVVSPRSEMK